MKKISILLLLALLCAVLSGCFSAYVTIGNPADTDNKINSSDTSKSSSAITEEKTKMKISCLGDSITNLGDGIKTYVDFLGDDTISFITQNVGLSGSALAIPKGSGANPALSERYVQIDSDADIILVFGGSNDFGHTEFPAELGDINSDSTDRFDFCGALRYLITTLRREHPNALIVYATPMRRNDVRWFETINFHSDTIGVNRFGHTLEDYRNAGIAVCESLDCPVIDMFIHPELNPLLPENDMKYYRDGLHLNDEGAKLLASYFTDEIKKLLSDK